MEKKKLTVLIGLILFSGAVLAGVVISGLTQTQVDNYNFQGFDFDAKVINKHCNYDEGCVATIEYNYLQDQNGVYDLITVQETFYVQRWEVEDYWADSSSEAEAYSKIKADLVEQWRNYKNQQKIYYDSLKTNPFAANASNIIISDEELS